MSNLAQRVFAGGEIAPALYARTDQQKYATSLRVLRNFLIRKHGSVTNRPGTSFAARTKASGAIRFMPFVRNDDTAYVLEFGDLYMRVYQAGAPILTSAAAFDPSAGYAIGDLASYAGVTYYSKTTHAFSAITPDAAPAIWYAMPGTVYEMPTPYLIADLIGLVFQYVQTDDVVTIVHPSYAPRELTRTSSTHWALTTKTIGAVFPAPASISVTGTVGPGLFWGVAAVDSAGNQGAMRTSGLVAVAPALATPATITYPAVTGAIRYNLYRGDTAAELKSFYVAQAGTLSVVDYGYATGDAAAIATPYNPFANPNDYPSVVTNYEQRMLYAATNNDPQRVWASLVGAEGNLNRIFPLQDDSPFNFKLKGRKAHAVRHLVDCGGLLIFTAGGEFNIGTPDTAFTPTTVNARQQLHHGAKLGLPPIVVGTAMLYMQARGTIVRAVSNTINDGYRSNDLSLYASHLFQGYTIVDWAFQESPDSILWAVRSDGVLLGLTYVREQEIWGWHRHDTDGVVENVCVIPEGDEDRLYLCVRRTINGATVRMVERMASRFAADPLDLIFMDAVVSYDGRNTSAVTMTLSGSGSWDAGELVTVERSVAAFTAGEIGNEIVLTGALDGEPVHVVLVSYTSPTLMQGFPNRLIPAELRGTPTTAWTRAVSVVSGLDHLEGKSLAVSADGYIVASPNNAEISVTCVVSGGAITLDAPYGYIHAGLPYIADLVTLDIDTPGGQSVKSQKFLVNSVMASLEQSRSVFVGGALPTGDDPLAFMDELKVREADDEYGLMALRTDTLDVTIQGHWEPTGRIAFRHVDPVPLTILAVMPRGHLSPAG